MKLKTRDRIAAVSCGLFGFWMIAVMMIQSLYQGLQQTIIASVHGGTYPHNFMQPEVAWYLYGLMIFTCILLAIGLVAEKKETSTGT